MSSLIPAGLAGILDAGHAIEAVTAFSDFMKKCAADMLRMPPSEL